MDYQMLAKFSYYRGRVAQAALLRALGIGQGDHVAIQAFTCLAVPEGVLATGAEPVYIDIEANGSTCQQNRRARLTPGTRAVIVQHTFGIPADRSHNADCRGTSNTGYRRLLP